MKIEGSPMTPTLGPLPLAQASKDELKQVKGVCLDIDDTLSTQGKLTAEAYSALWNLKNAGFYVVPITGRPAGWCDNFARFWPVDAIVGENGAFTFFMRDGVRKRIDTPAQAAPEALKKMLHELSEKVRARFPHARWASDQHYREYDLAIDICEDVPTWPRQDIDALLELCHQEGAHAKLSSIHVNTWFGHYDKRKGFEHWLKSDVAPQAAPAWDEWLFIGDSPNDEPMFAAFKYTVGVANLKNYLDRLNNPPRWMTSRESGGGFAEMAEKLITSRG
jgi:HAD superfamily hydrolase (TIGR01484 family)